MISEFTQRNISFSIKQKTSQSVTLSFCKQVREGHSVIIYDCLAIFNFISTVHCVAFAVANRDISVIYNFSKRLIYIISTQWGQTCSLSYTCTRVQLARVELGI